MRSTMQSTGGQAPASAAATNAELARVDAQLELAAKKAALAGMQKAAAAGQGADGGPAAVIAGDETNFPAVGSPAGGRITFESGGKTITIDNPTAEQLQLVGVAASGSRNLEGWQAVAITGAVMWCIVAVVWIVLAHRRRMRGVGAHKSSPDMDARMARIENAIESVAVEVERISEGQRYTSRMLSEGAARPVGVAQDNLAAVLQNRGDA